MYCSIGQCMLQYDNGTMWKVGFEDSILAMFAVLKVDNSLGFGLSKSYCVGIKMFFYMK